MFTLCAIIADSVPGIHTSTGIYCWWFYLHCCCRSSPTDARSENYAKQLDVSVDFPDNGNAGRSWHIFGRMIWASTSL
uniref:Uncharacterized protein n=1 Tax=Triticum urartu TaxID=4572 RepID=A0A8R7TST5_TRIUA